MKYAFDTNIGNYRQTNEDSTTIIQNKNGDLMAVICDGMGGHLGGYYASSRAIDLIGVEFLKAPSFASLKDLYNWIYNTVERINSDIFNKSNADSSYKGMGTTLVLTIITKKYKVFANIGDSRLYKFEKGDLIQISEDQTLVGALIRSGYLSREEARNHPKMSMLLNALGTSPQLDIQISDYSISNGFLLLCSDGLYNMVHPETIKEVLSNKKASIENKVKQLIDIANANGGQDNITVNIIEVNKQ